MKELAAALVAAQAEMPAVDKDATNPHFRSSFVSLDHLIALTKPVLTKHGLTIVQLPSTVGDAPALATTILHTSGESLTDTLPLVLAKQDMQGLGAALTYARRYSWAAALGICDETDDDGNTASQVSPTASDGHSPTVGGPAASAGAGVSPTRTPPAGAAPTEKQLGYLGKLMADKQVTDLGKPLSELSKGECSEWIEAFKDGSYEIKLQFDAHEVDPFEAEGAALPF